MTVDERLRRCFREVFPDMPDADIEQADMQRLGSWNSFALLKLLARIEKEFALRLSSEQINRFTSYARILDALASPGRVNDPAGAPVDAWH